MKNVILYGLIFSVLFNIFQYVNSTKILDAKDKEVTKIQERLRTSRDSVSALATANYFALESDEDAQEYFYTNNLDYKKVSEKVKEDLLVLNENKNGNKLKNHLIKNKIFIATYWPGISGLVDLISTEMHLVTNLVCIPIDQRYDEKDMESIKNIVNSK